YHFQLDETPSVIDAESSIHGFYDADRRETLLVVPLRREVDLEELEQFIVGLGAQALVFLRSTRRLLYMDFVSGQTMIDHRLRERYETDVVAGAQRRLREHLRIGRDEEKRLEEIVYEEKGLDRVLTRADQEGLVPGFSAVIPEDRDRAGRWRRVLQELGRSR